MPVTMTRRVGVLSISAAAVKLGLPGGVHLAWAADLVRVGRSSATGFEFSILDVGIAEGFFQKNGVDIQIFELPGSGNQRALASGDIDVALGTGVELALIVKGSPVKAVAAMAGPPLNMGLIVRGDSPLQPNDFKGRTIAVSAAHSLTDWLAMEFSRQQGWGDNGVNRIALGGPDAMIAALRSKNADGIVASTATGYRLEEHGQGKVLLTFGARIRDFLTHVIFASDGFIKRRPDALRGFLKGWFETVTFMTQYRSEAIRLSRKTTQLSEKMADRTYDEQMPMFYEDGHFPEKNLKGTESALADMGALAKAPVDSELIDERFLPSK